MTPIVEDDIDQMFQDDVREKKRNGIGIYSKSGSRGRTGRIYMPTDFMSKKDKKQYTKSSKVEVTFMQSTIMPFNQFQGLPKEDQKKTLILYRKKHTVKDIKNAWLIEGEPMPDYQFYAIMKNLGINSSRPSKPPEERSEQQSITNVMPIPTYAKAPAFAIGMNGEFSAEDMVARLMKFAALLENEQGKFTIQLVIEGEK